MSDDTLIQIIGEHIGEHIGRNIRPLLKWAYTGVAAIVGGTAMVVGMWYDLKGTTADAQRDATKALNMTEQHLEPMLNNHETRIAVMEARSPK